MNGGFFNQNHLVIELSTAQYLDFSWLVMSLDKRPFAQYHLDKTI
jgi:hypothetical protein